MRRSAAFFLSILLVLVASQAEAKKRDQGRVVSNGCAAGTYSAVTSPDGIAISILFDNFSITAPAGADRGIERRTCNVAVELDIPQDHSLGVYRVDYRGFARLSAGQRSDLNVEYSVGSFDKRRRHRGKLKGEYDGEFIFTEKIGRGLMKRLGCGGDTVLNVAASLELQTRREPAESMIALDSIDGASENGLIYHFDLRRCGKKGAPNPAAP